MRFLACLLLFTVWGLSQAQNPKETFGKTHAQILAMGYGKWYEFYTGKTGETTQDMAQVGYKFAEALRWRNKGLEAKLDASRRNTIAGLRRSMEEFGTYAIQVERALNGGGTMWFLTFSSNAMDVEQTVYGLLGGQVKAAEPMVVSMVTKELGKLEARLKAAPASTWQFEFTKTETTNYFQKAKASFNYLTSLAKKLDRKKSDLVLSYCRDVFVKAQMS